MRRVPPSSSVALPQPLPAKDLAAAAIELKRAARQLGFSECGLASAELPPAELARLEAWVAAEHHGSMGYMARDPAERADPGRLLADAQTVLMVSLPYPATRGEQPDPQPPNQTGYVSSYAQGPYDYHQVLGGRLEQLAEFLRALIPGANARRICDTAPVLERAYAREAGLGFVGKNTCLISSTQGSYVFLGGLLIDRPLPPDSPDPLGSCGTCTRCLDACPTDAFSAPFVLDARRCIAYLTIEHRGAYPEALREQVGSHLFGCDICQSVCPWNKFAPPSDPELEPDPARVEPGLSALYDRIQAGFKSLGRGTAWERTGKRGWLRNLATAMGNAQTDHSRELTELAEHPDPGVAEHARWALARAEQVRASGAGYVDLTQEESEP